MLFSIPFHSWHGLCNKYCKNDQHVAWATLANEGIMMKTGKVENGLALLGVLIVLLGVTSAANMALADEADTLDSTLKIEAPTSN
jgi:hypothetical protein